MRIFTLLVSALLALLSTTGVEGFWIPWRKKPTWVHDHFIKHGINEPIASAALRGLSDQQLLEMSQLEVRVLTKLLRSLQKSMEETKAISHFVLPGADTHLTEAQREQLQRASLYLAASMRRSVDLVFDAMEGKIKDRDMWTRAMKNAHTFVMRNVCDALNDMPLVCSSNKIHLPFHHHKTIELVDEL